MQRIIYIILYISYSHASSFKLSLNQLFGNSDYHRGITKQSTDQYRKNNFEVGPCKRRKLSMSWKVFGVL